jgi:hypothetical protein
MKEMYHEYMSAEESGLVVGGCREVGEIAASDAPKFFADNVGGETGAEKHAVKRGDFPLVECAAQVREAALETCADEHGFVCIREHGGNRSVDVHVGNSTASKFAYYAEAALAAGLRVMPSVFEGIASVVKVIELAEAREDRRDQVFIFGAAFEVLLHFVDRIGTAHEGALGGHVELVLGAEFAGAFGSHVG